MSPRFQMPEWLRVGVLAALCAAFPLAVSAQQGGGEAEEESLEDAEARETPAMRPMVYDPLAEAAACVEEQDFECAEQILQDVMEIEDKNSYETAVMWQFVAFVAFEYDDTPRAIDAYENVLEQMPIPLGLEQDTALTLAQLHNQQEQFEEALSTLDHWFSISPDPGPDPYVLKSQIHYQLNEYTEAIGPLETAIQINEERGNAPEENWYVLLNVLYYELENFDRVIEITAFLLENWPGRQYLLQLAGMYSQEGRDQDALALFEAGHDVGWLERGAEHRALASMLIGEGVPYKAGVILREGLDSGLIEETENNWRMLASAWQQAKEDERALPALRQAAELSGDGDIFFRLAVSHAALSQWEDCAEAAREALDQGTEREDNTYLTLGSCLVEMGDLDAAQRAFRDSAAAASSGQMRRQAEQWVSWIDSERDRGADLAAALEQAEEAQAAAAEAAAAARR